MFFVFIFVFLWCFDMVGWVIRPVKYRPRNDPYCVEWDVKLHSAHGTSNLDGELGSSVMGRTKVVVCLG